MCSRTVFFGHVVMSQRAFTALRLVISPLLAHGRPVPNMWKVQSISCNRKLGAKLLRNTRGCPFLFCIVFIFLYWASISAGYIYVTPLLLQVSVVNRATVDLFFVFQNTLMAPVTVAEYAALRYKSGTRPRLQCCLRPCSQQSVK